MLLVKCCRPFTTAACYIGLALSSVSFFLFSSFLLSFVTVSLRHRDGFFFSHGTVAGKHGGLMLMLATRLLIEFKLRLLGC